MRKDSNKKYIWFLILLFISICALLIFLFIFQSDVEPISLTKMFHLIKSNTITNAEIDDATLVVTTLMKKKHSCILPNDPSWITYMINHKINVTINRTSGGEGIFYVILKFFFNVLETGLYIMLLIWITMRGSSQGSIGGENGEVSNVKFDDVAGLKKEKEELKEVVFAMKNIKDFERYKCTPLKGVLLYGPPGNGKTLLGKAIAGETDYMFFHTSASEFVELYVGSGPRKVRQLFGKARKAGKAIVFIDEADALGNRSKFGRHENSERANTINQLLVEMDGILTNDNLIVIFATNHAGDIDPALLRKGRIDREIEIGNPDFEDRLEVLKLSTKDLSLNSDVDLSKLAKGLIGFSRASLVNVVNEAKFLAMRDKTYGITMKHLEKAKDRVILGIQKDITKQQEKDLKLTAYHESGHAYMMYYYNKHLDPIYKATIIPHGHALGVVIPEPLNDKVSYTKIFIECEIQTFFAGRICEELFFGLDNVTSGCSSDIEKARQFAEHYVRYGMKNSYGLKYYSQNSELTSEAEKQMIFTEVTQLMTEMEQLARDILIKNQDSVARLAEALLVAETLTGKEIVDILENKVFLPIPYNNNPIIQIKKSNTNEK